MQIFTFRKSLTVIALSLLCCVAYAQKTVILETPGKLSEKISGAEKYTTTSLVISGPINGADILFLREMAGRNQEGGKTEGTLQCPNRSATIFGVKL